MFLKKGSRDKMILVFHVLICHHHHTIVSKEEPPKTTKQKIANHATKPSRVPLNLEIPIYYFLVWDRQS